MPRPLGSKQSEETRLKISQAMKRLGIKPPSSKGRKVKEETRKKLREANLGEKSHKWKGNEVGYQALHSWVRSRLGNPKYCSKCQKVDAKQYDWANISRKYRRELSDWIRLCRSCHVIFDMKKDTNEKKSANNARYWLGKKFSEEHKRKSYENRKKNIFLVFNGERKTLSEWGRKFRIPKTTLFDKYHRGETLEQIVTNYSNL